MGKLGAFKEINRELPDERPIETRIRDYGEIYHDFPIEKLQAQGSRCMNCGIPFCNSGCPLGNSIPEWNHAVSRDRMHEAFLLLSRTNNFPEFTGRLCPAPCEESCVLNIDKKPVTIRLIEEQIIEHAFREGWVRAEPPAVRTGKKVAVVGSGPAGLACAAQLNKAGHHVTVFERADRIGGLLLYGIPNFKLDKSVIDRRLAILREEGIDFQTSTNIGFNFPVEDLRLNFQAVVFCCGSTAARRLDVPGSNLQGIHFAVDYLTGQTKSILAGQGAAPPISAEGQHVVVLGGGDTGADCVGTALRQGARSICQFELLPEPPKERTSEMPWPCWPMILRTSSSHKELEALMEGAASPPVRKRDFSINTKEFLGENGRIKKLRGVRLEWGKNPDGRMSMREIEGSQFEIDCQLCLLALGFLHPEHPGPIEQLRLERDARGNVKVDHNYMTNVPGVFCAGDMRRGQSLIVWAMSEGRQAARAVDLFLTGKTALPALKLF